MNKPLPWMLVLVLAAALGLFGYQNPEFFQARDVEEEGGATETVAKEVPQSYLKGAEEQPQNDKDRFFAALLVGGAENGLVYVELPLKPAFYEGAETYQEKEAVWNNFISRAVKAPGELVDETNLPYAGEYLYKDVDWEVVAQSVSVKVSEDLRFRTPSMEGVAKVARLALHVSEGTIPVLAEGKPLEGQVVPKAEFIVAGRDLPRCLDKCTAQARIPDEATRAKIRAAVDKDARHALVKETQSFIVLEGQFTRAVPQYIAYIFYGGDVLGSAFWRTAVLDTDMSVIAILGENSYGHIIPLSTTDIDGDGLDEVFAKYQGYEGESEGVIYWRGGTGNDAFRAISNTYIGL